MSKSRFLSVHPLVFFFLGILVGAIVVGLIFFYKAFSPELGENAIYRGGKSVPNGGGSFSQSSTQFSVPGSDVGKLKGSSMPDPDGGVSNDDMPDPDGGKSRKR